MSHSPTVIKEDVEGEKSDEGDDSESTDADRDEAPERSLEEIIDVYSR